MMNLSTLILVFVCLVIVCVVFTAWIAYRFGTRMAGGTGGDRTPWYKNAFAFSLMALYNSTQLLAAEVALILADVPGGLPEALSTPLFGVTTGLLGYAGACINLRADQIKGVSA